MSNEAVGALALLLILVVIVVKWIIEYGDRVDRKRVERKTEQRLDKEAYGEWQREVADGRTSVGYAEWRDNRASRRMTTGTADRA